MFPKETFEIKTTPADLERRLLMMDRQWDKIMGNAMKQAMKAAHQAVPDYPPKPPRSTYVRTGRLGQGLGYFDGRRIYKNPTVYTQKLTKPGMWEGRLGSNEPFYTARVVGLRQEFPWKRYWWNEKTWRDLAEKPVLKIFFEAAKDIGRYLSGQSQKLKGA
jgi:hypothetical protein